MNSDYNGPTEYNLFIKTLILNMEEIAAGRRGTVSHLVPDEIIKNTNLITAEQRAAVRLTREEKRLIFFMNKALEALDPEERANILKVLNINPPDLQPISENEFRKLVADREAAFIKYKYHHDRRLANYFKIKDFMDNAQRRHGSGGVIYLSKEGSKLLLRKKNAKSIGGAKKYVRGQLDLEAHNTVSIDRLSDRSKGSARRNYAVKEMSPNPADKVFQKKLSMPVLGTLGAEVIVNDKLMRRQRKLLKHAQVQRNKEALSQQKEMRIHKILNKSQTRKKEKVERQQEEELEKQDQEEQKEEKKKRLLQSKKTLDEEYFQKLKSIETRLQQKQQTADDLAIEAKMTSASPLLKGKVRKQGSISKENLRMLNYQSNSAQKMGVKPIIKVNNFDGHTTTNGGDDLSVLHDNYSSHEKRSAHDKKERQHVAHYNYNHAAYRMRPATAQADYNHKLYERAAKRHAQFNDENIENLKISIECKMLNAEQKKKQRIAMISHNIRVDNFKKEQMQLNKLKQMDNVLNPVVTEKKGKSEGPDSHMSSVELVAGRPSSSRLKQGGHLGSQPHTLSKVQSARQIHFTSLNRQVTQGDQYELTPGKHSVGLLESHIQPTTRAALDIKLGQNMLKQQQALQNIYMKQSKVDVNRQTARDEKKYQDEEKQEKIQGRREQASQKRTKIHREKFNRIQSAIARKEKPFSDDGAHSSSNRSSAQGKVWKNLAVKDQREKIERMHEVQRAYKERLFEEMWYKEEKYNKLQVAKKQLVQSAQMPADYGVISLIEQEKGRNQANKSLFNVQKSSYNVSTHEIPTNLQVKKGVY